MRNLETLLISPDTSLFDTIERIDAGNAQVALIIDPNRRLLGLVTDGDIRRAILQRISLDDPVSTVMKRNPQTATEDMDDHNLLYLMRIAEVQQVPLLNESGQVVGLRTLKALIKSDQTESRVVLMAGGLGTRLRPLTETMPKPMLPVGDRPLLEIIIKAFLAQGFRHFSISLNYQGAVIKDHFGDGDSLGVEIDYIEENRPMGTAGGLTFLKDRPTAPFIVMNGDILTSLNFRQLLHFHQDAGTPATMVVREQNLQIPYGVVDTDGLYLQAIEEKPTQHFFINAGIYVLDPEVLDLLGPEQPLDMTDLFLRLKERGTAPAVFPMQDYWLDIGQPHDLERAKAEYSDVFKS